MDQNVKQAEGRRDCQIQPVRERIGGETMGMQGGDGCAEREMTPEEIGARARRRAQAESLNRRKVALGEIESFLDAQGFLNGKAGVAVVEAQANVKAAELWLGEALRVMDR